MMKKCAFLLLVSFALVFFTGCGGSSRKFADPAWFAPPSSITILATEPFVDNESDVLDDFGSFKSFRLWYVSYLERAFNQYFAATPYVRSVSDEDVEPKLVNWDGKDMKIPYFKRDKLDSLSGLVVTIDSLRFWRDVEPNARQNCAGKPRLNATLFYSIFSIEDDRLLAYGNARVDDTFAFAMDRVNWENVLDRVVQRVVDFTPLDNGRKTEKLGVNSRVIEGRYN